MKSKFFAPLLTIGAFLMLMPNETNVLASSGYGGGSGTESDPYLISTAEHLNQLQLDVNVNGVDTSGKYYRLIDDIDLSDYDNDSDESNGNFTPIGSSYSVSFKGTFDGDGKVISNLKIVLSEQNYVGLFGYTSSATIQNLGLEDALVEGTQYVGGLVGYQSSGTIVQNYLMGNVSGSKYVGGLVGCQNGSSSVVSQSYATGSVSGSSYYVGGLVGYQSFGTISQSFVDVTLKGSGEIGGLAGYASGKINESYSMGEVNGSSDEIGGLVGKLSGTVSLSYSVSNVVGKSYYTNIGKLIGEKNSNAIVENSYWSSDSSGGSSSWGIGVTSEGLLGDMAYYVLEGFDFDNTWVLCEGEYPKLRFEQGMCSEIEKGLFVLSGEGTEVNPYRIRTEEELLYVSRLMDAGGNYLFKNYSLESNLDLSNYDTDEDETNGNWSPLAKSSLAFRGVFDGNGYVISNVEVILPQQNYVGFFAYTGSATIKNLGLENIAVEGSSYVGGLVGYSYSGTSDENYVYGNIKGNGSYVGGISGYESGGMTGSYTKGEVIGVGGYVGGLVGRQVGGTISESYSTAYVSGGGDVGGLVGYQSSGTVNKSYATGEVNGGNDVGGLVGYKQSGTINQSYAIGDATGSAFVGGLVGDQSGGTINQSYAIGDASGSSNVGGLVGDQGGGTISQSYAIGDATGSSYNSDVGSLVGNQDGGTISQSYAIGKVSGRQRVGGLVGYQSSSAIVENSYWNVETTGKSSSQGGVGLTTKQMTKRKAKENMVGFDFDGVWQLSNGYPLLYWQTPDPIKDRELIINGTIEATILSLTIPSSSMTFALNPNEEVGKQFIASDFELINGSKAPLTLELKNFEQVTDILNDVESTKYSDWNGLNKTQSKDIALALVPKVGDGWLTLNEGNRWVAHLGETVIGTIKGNSSVSFGFEVKHGSSFTETLTPQYKLTFIFGLQD